ncbi:MAG: hypothetical protein JSS82_14675 [Bacteroidetes bacterium]|nr:hypothetical protein [Bacteroidota bacterium]
MQFPKVKPKDYLEAVFKEYTHYAEAFLSWDYEPIKRERPKTFAALLAMFAKAFVFFRGKAVEEKFEQMGLTDQFSKWFVDYDHICEMLQSVNEQKVFCDPLLVLSIIHLYLDSKINNEVLIMLDHYKKHDGSEKKNVAFKLFHDYFERRKYSKEHQGSRSEFDKELDNISASLEVFFENEYQMRRYLLDNIQGKTEKHLLPSLLESFFIFQEGNVVCYRQLSVRKGHISQTRFLNILFPLFKRLLVDHYFMDEATYNQRNLPYGKYDRYKAERLKKIIFKS